MPGPFLSRNFPIVVSGDSGESSWMYEPLSPTASIASRTPCSSLTSVWTQRIPKLFSYSSIAASRSATAMPTWSMCVICTGGSFGAAGCCWVSSQGRISEFRRSPVASSADRSVIVGGARTPIGKFSGGFKDLTAMDLGGIAIEAALERAGISGGDVDYVIMGQVLQAGQG